VKLAKPAKMQSSEQHGMATALIALNPTGVHGKAVDVLPGQAQAPLQLMVEHDLECLVGFGGCWGTPGWGLLQWVVGGVAGGVLGPVLGGCLGGT